MYVISVAQYVLSLRYRKLLILSRLNDFMTCSEHFNIKSEGSISQFWNTVGR